jgi:hypothetical protein
MSDAEVDEREVILQSIEQEKAELRDAVDELKEAVKKEVDIGEWIADNAAMFLGGGFLLGLWFGLSRPNGADLDLR